ncbi:hypothetical protein GCM10023212_06950 [Luteolibacter yonseiensis]
MFGGIKDSLTSVAAKSLLASRLERYGKLTEFHLSSRDRTISAEILLEGELEPVAIHIGRYRIKAEAEEYLLEVEEISVSRIWLQNLLEDLLVGKPLPVPAMLLLALGKPEP